MIVFDHEKELDKVLGSLVSYPGIHTFDVQAVLLEVVLIEIGVYY